MASGEQFVMMGGLIRMQLWSVDSLATSKENLTIWDVHLMKISDFLSLFLTKINFYDSIENTGSMLIWFRIIKKYEVESL